MLWDLISDKKPRKSEPEPPSSPQKRPRKQLPRQLSHIDYAGFSESLAAFVAVRREPEREALGVRRWLDFPQHNVGFFHSSMDVFGDIAEALGQYARLSTS